jgi:hypothetical protein
MPPVATLAYSKVLITATSGHRQGWEAGFNVDGLTRSDDPLAAAGLPVLGMLDDSGWVCNSLEARLDPDLESFAAVVAQWTLDPIFLPIEISWYTSHDTRAAWKQQQPFGENDPNRADPYLATEHSERIVNRAGDLYSPPLTYDRPLIRMEVVRRYRNEEFVPNVITDFCFHKNSNKFYLQYTDGNGHVLDLGVFPAGSMYLADVRAPEVFEPYYHKQVTWSFEIDYDLWLKRVPNIGPRCTLAGLSASDPRYGKPFPPRDPNGALLNGLALLDRDGHQLQPTGNPPRLENGIIDLVFNVVGTADFNLLNLLDPVKIPDVHPNYFLPN